MKRAGPLTFVVLAVPLDTLSVEAGESRSFWVMGRKIDPSGDLLDPPHLDHVVTVPKPLYLFTIP